MTDRQANIRTGKADVDPDTPSHTKGTREGNETGAYAKQAGLERDDRHTSRRSTGIRPRDRNTVVPGSPELSPP